MKTAKKYTWWDSFKTHPFVTKLFLWEFWPFHIRYAPIYWYWLFLSLKARSFFFFSNTNPGIKFSGMMGESKQDITNQLPLHLKPIGFKLPAGKTTQEIIHEMEQNDLHFPVILKPDKGERGIGVERVNDREELQSYMSNSNIELIIQEYISYPSEFGILYYRFPGQKSGVINSVTVKRPAKIIGDGQSTFYQLLFYNKRTRIHISRWKLMFIDKLDTIPEDGEEIILSEIGNHSRGATFFDGKKMIDNELVTVFDSIVDSLDEFYIGRFDIKCQNLDQLKKGEFKIIELNGVGAEPTHIYEPGYSAFSFYRDIINFWSIIYKIGAVNKKRGFPYTRFKEGRKIIKEYNQELRKSLQQ